MGRAVSRRYWLTGELVAQSAVSVASGNDETAAVADSTVVRDGMGRPLLPGTTLAGVLQQRLREAGSEWADDASWWGDSEDEGASRIEFDDAPAIGPVRTEVRDQVTIDRVHAVAAPQRRFSREVAPPGTRFPLSIVVECPQRRLGDAADGVGNPPGVLADLVSVLEGAGLAVGASTSSGLGRVRAQSLLLRAEVVDQPEGMLAALAGFTALDPLESEELITAWAERWGEVGPRRLQIEIPWRAVSAILTKVPIEAAVADAIPVTTWGCDGVRLVLPGSSIRGALSSQAAYIARTLAAADAPQDVAEQLADPVLGPVLELFGVASDLTADDSGRRGALDVHECHSTVVLTHQEWRGVLSALHHRRDNVPDGEDQHQWLTRKLVDALDLVNAAHRREGLDLRLTPHVALDRFTGGAAPGRLFAHLEPHQVRGGPDLWEPMRLEVDLGRLPDPKLAVAALLILVRQLADGRIRLGGEVTRGLGGVVVEDNAVRFRVGHGADPSWEPLHGVTLHDVLTCDAGPLGDLVDGLQQRWQQYEWTSTPVTAGQP